VASWTYRSTPAGGVIAGLAVVAVLLAGCTGDPSTTRTSEQGAGVAGTPGLSRYEPGGRKSAPVAAGPSLDEKGLVSTADYRGKVVVLNVWESTCGPCRAEAPDLLRASHDTADTAVFVGLNARDRQLAAAQAFVRSHGIDYPQISDPSGQQLLNFAGTLPLNSIPTTLVIDREGLIAARIIGTITAASLTQLVNDVHSGR
jgi:thiol-disulfide isomerase/thioredoxin